MKTNYYKGEPKKTIYYIGKPTRTIYYIGKLKKTTYYIGKLEKPIYYKGKPVKTIYYIGNQALFENYYSRLCLPLGASSGRHNLVIGRHSTLPLLSGPGWGEMACTRCTLHPCLAPDPDSQPKLRSDTSTRCRGRSSANAWRVLYTKESEKRIIATVRHSIAIPVVHTRNKSTLRNLAGNS